MGSITYKCTDDPYSDGKAFLRVFAELLPFPVVWGFYSLLLLHKWPVEQYGVFAGGMFGLKSWVTRWGVDGWVGSLGLLGRL